MVAVRVLGMDDNSTKAGGVPWWEFDVVTGEKLLDISFDPAGRDDGTIKYTHMAWSNILEITEIIWKFKYQIRVFFPSGRVLDEVTTKYYSLTSFYYIL